MTGIKEMIEACESAADIPVRNGGAHFTQWEEEFIESIAEQFEARGTLTDRQVEILTKLWDKT